MHNIADIAIIGGSGIYDVSLLDNVREVNIDTPFGNPSDVITIGERGDKTVCFLPRHGTGHRISPSRLNSRANIFALKKLGGTRPTGPRDPGPDIRPYKIKTQHVF